MFTINSRRLSNAMKCVGSVVGISAALAVSQTATASCTYSIQSEWNTGFVANITVKNDTGAAVNGWSVNWQYSANRVSNSWNAVLSGSNPYTATNMGWNGSIAAGQSVTFGFQGVLNNSSPAEKPVVNGTLCGTTSSVASSVSSSSRSSSLSSSSRSSSLSSSSRSSSSSVISSSSRSSSSSQMVISSSRSSSSQSSSSTAVSSSAASSSSAVDLTLLNHDQASDYVWNTSSEVLITLQNTTATANGAGVSITGGDIVINTPGNYRVTGTLNQGQLKVAATGLVRVILDDASIHNANSAALFLTKSDKVIVMLDAGSYNTLSDTVNYVFAEGEDEPNATLFSKVPLTIAGTGTLEVKANYNDAIGCKDGMLVKNGSLIVNSVDDGIRGKDYLLINGGSIQVTSTGDALKSDNDAAGTGIVMIDAGNMTLTTSQGDGIDANMDLVIRGGTFNIKSKGDVNLVSAKALKGSNSLAISGGTFDVTADDDAIHSNNTVNISGGTFNLTTADDGVHADVSVAISGGTLRILGSYEGIEGRYITVSDSANIDLVSNDDGVNISFEGNIGGLLDIRGGRLFVNANGDGLDSNSNITMNGGVVVVNGPTANNNGPIDYDGTFMISGGYLVAAGSSGMAQAPSTSSSQNSIKVTSSRTANTLFAVRTAAGENLLRFAPTKNYQSVVFSAPSLTTGLSISTYFGGSNTGTATRGLYESGTYTTGTLYKTVSVVKGVTSL